MNKLTISLLTVFILPLTLLSQTGPGGVGNSTTNSLWLKANQGTSSTVDSSKVESWKDASGNSNIVSQTEEKKQPLYKSNTFNGYPSVYFGKTGTNNHLLSGFATNVDSTSGMTIFSVVKKSSYTNSDAQTIISKRNKLNDNHAFMFFFWRSKRLNVDYTNDTNRFGTSKSFADNEKLLVSTMFNGALATDKRSTIYEGNTLLFTWTKNSSFIEKYNSPVIIGATNTLDPRSFDGDIAEVITYRIALNRTQRIIVNNYLSAKYDVPLTDDDLYTMDKSTNGDYDHEVAGIGYLTETDNHLEAQGTAIVEISNASDIKEKFLLWGHNNKIQQAIVTNNVPATVEARFERVWRASSVTQRGDAANVGTISMQFDLNGLGNIDPTNLRLLISTDGNFTNANVIPGAIHVSGSLYRFNGVQLNDGNFFTLGTTNIVVTPLPITLLDFTAVKDGKNVILNWRTASEQNNDRFEIERTVDGYNWEVIHTVEGSGNSNTVISYNAIDRKPANGTNYYRLKQVDFNGESTVSSVRSVLFDAPVALSVYPNPATNFVTINRGVNSSVQLINDLGQTVISNQEISDDSTILDVSSLTSGVYFVRVQDEEEIITRKIIIIKD